MDIQTRVMHERDIEEIVQLSLLAWEPVFTSFRHVLGSRIYLLVYPDWKASQRSVVETMCRNQENFTVWVAERDVSVVGFVLCELNVQDQVGEVQLLAVHPAHQKRGIGTVLNNLALQHMREHGMKLAVVGTGGDPGHTPARAAYEKAGYTALPLVRYYQALTELS
ncbi:MAG: GNAT family N-acetyltransferase [Roseiflexaceae bacterium]